MLDLTTDIQSLTDFKRHTNEYYRTNQAERPPLGADAQRQGGTGGARHGCILSEDIRRVGSGRGYRRHSQRVKISPRGDEPALSEEVFEVIRREHEVPR